MSFATSAAILDRPSASPSLFSDLQEVWYSLYDTEGGLPKRKDFRPNSLRSTTLRQVILLEMGADASLKKRLVGSVIDSLYGSAFGDCGPLEANNALVAERFHLFCSQLQSGQSWGRIVRSVGQNPDTQITSTTYLFPFAGPDGRVSTLIGAIDLEAPTYQSLGLGRTLTKNDVASTLPKHLEIFPIGCIDAPGVDLMQPAYETLQDGYWTNRSALA